MVRSSVLSLLVLLAFSSAAHANTQSITDGDDGVAEPGYGKTLDVRAAELSQGGGQTWVDVTIEHHASRSPLDAIWVAFDVNGDGTGDHIARLRGFDDATASLSVHSTTNSSANCQQLGTGTVVSDAVPVPAADGAGLQKLELHFDTALIGGAASHRWGVYAQNDSFQASTFDYAPDALNPGQSRPNPKTTSPKEFDGCDDDGDGFFGDDTDRKTNHAADAAVPLKMSGGTAFPAEPASSGGGSNSGGSTASGPGGGTNPFVPDPVLVAIPAPETLKTIKFPDVRPGSAKCKKRFCTESRVRSLLRGMGLRNYNLVLGQAEYDDIPKRLKGRVQHGDVVLQSPAPGTEIGEPNVAAYPDAERPKVRLGIWEEPQLKYGCKDDGIEDILDGMAWPGQTTGSGNRRVYGAQAILDRKGCDYQLTYRKEAGVTEPRIGKAKDGNPVRLRISLPKTTEFSIFVTEGSELPQVLRQKLVGPLADGTMPLTDKGEGIVVVRVMETRTAPSVPAPAGVVVTVRDPTDAPVAIAKTLPGGIAILKGHFTHPGTHRVEATSIDANGLSLDGEGAFPVGKLGSKITLGSGRRFKFKDGRWVKLVATGKLLTARRAKAHTSAAWTCEVTAENRDNMAAYVASLMRGSVEELAKATTLEDRQTHTGHFVNRYLGARKAGLLDHIALQQLLSELQISVPNLGAGDLQPVTGLCTITTTQQARQQVRGFDLSGPLPVIATPRGLGLADGTTITGGAFSYTSFNVAPAPAADQLRLSADERALILQALIGATGGANLASKLRDALTGVISTGGGNVISTGGGNMTGVKPRLTAQQLRMIMAVISTGGLNVISTGGGNLTPTEKAAAQKVISTGGGNLIGQAGGNMTDNQLRGLLRIISTDGASLISDKGLGLTAAEIDAVQAVISTGGGNLTSDTLRDALHGVISTGGGNLAATVGSVKAVDVAEAVISTGGGNLIGQAGGNLKAKEVLASFVNGVISTGGLNLKDSLSNLSQVISTGGGNLTNALIGQAGGNLISDKGLG